MKKLLLAAGLALAMMANPAFAQKAEPSADASKKASTDAKKATDAAAKPAPAAAAKPAPAAAAAPAKAEPMDINTASEKELATLKGIGEARAKAIVKGRPYKGKDELVQKKIIPQAVYDDVKDQIIAKQGEAKKADAKPAAEPKKAEAAKPAEPKKDEKKK